MVLYFSATGNTKFIAELIAERTGDEILDLTKRIKENDFSPVRSKKPFVICCPIYVCDMPPFFERFLRELKFEGSRRVYFIFTSGSGYSGVAGYIAEKLIRRKKMIFMGYTDFRMPSNYMVRKKHKGASEDKIHELIDDGRYKARITAAVIRHKKKLFPRYVYVLEKSIIIPFEAVWTKVSQPSKKFCAGDKCAGCGKCAAVCPVNNITMKDGRPVWSGKQCAHCMACISNCPVGAVEYGDITVNREKYNLRKYLKNSK